MERSFTFDLSNAHANHLHIPFHANRNFLSPCSKLSQEDSKIFANARYLDKFFEEQLQKWLPDYAAKKPGKHGSADKDASYESASKRSKTATEDDDDVILA